MNIYDIARIAGVSIATVSRVVNGSDKVSEKTRKRVLEIIDQTEYKPNAFAQGLGLNTMHTVGILVPDISDIYMSSAVSFLEQQLHQNGYECILSCSGFVPERKHSHVQMLLSKHIDALILVGSTYAGSGDAPQETDYIREAAQQVPVFLINGVVDGDNICCCVCNDRSTVYDAVQGLIRSGRRRILFLSDSGSYSARQKHAGYEQALLDAGIPVDNDLVMRIRKNRIHEVRDLLLSRSDLVFDAVMCVEDALAVGVVKYAAAKHLQIPSDLSIIGYNNSVLAVASQPELTSIDSRLSDMCSDTVSHLIRKLQEPSSADDFPRVSVKPGKIVHRNTTD